MVELSWRSSQVDGRAKSTHTKGQAELEEDYPDPIRYSNLHRVRYVISESQWRLL